MKKIQSFLVVLFVLTFCAYSFAQVAEVKNARFNSVRDTIMTAVTDGRIPSMSVAVAKNGKVIWEESFGWANREKRIPATPHTMYSMASVSKPICTTGLMILVDQGKVNLDDPVNKYIAPLKLTAFEGSSDDVTVRHILNHTAGLPLHYSVFYPDEPERPVPPKEETIHKYGIIVHEPGKCFQYSNFAFSLADYIIEKVSGRPFSAYMKKEVFLPLGMYHASIDIAPGLEKYAAERYRGDGEPVPFYVSDHPGASEVYCSAHDLIRFGLFHLKAHLKDQKRILKDETIDLMKKDSDPNPENNRYGLAWFLRDDDFGYPVVWHTGSMRGVNNMLKFVPSEKIAVVVLTNIYTDLRVKIANDIIGILLPEYGKKWKEKRDQPSPEREPFAAPGELWGTWKGKIVTYENTVPVTFTIQEDSDIHIKIKGQMETLLNNCRYEDNTLTGVSYGSIPSSDAARFEHDIFYKLILEENRLSGYVSTEFHEKRSYGNFSSYIMLEKQD